MDSHSTPSRKRRRLATPEPPIALAALFFPLTLHLAEGDASGDASGDINDVNNSAPVVLPPDTTAYRRALSRVEALVGPLLTPDMAAALNSLLSVTHAYLSGSTAGNDPPHCPILQVASPELLSDDSLRDMANTINTALVDFAARGGGRTRSQTESSIPSSPSLPPAPGQSGPPTALRTKTISTSSRSQKIHKLCAERDKNTCHLTKRSSNGECCHILPFSLKDDKALNFWTFISLFRGKEETIALRNALSMTSGSSMDMLTNVWWLTEDVHACFDKGSVTILPQLTPEQLPYDPASTSEYSAIVEFPFGSEKAPLAVYSFDARGRLSQLEQLKPGHIIRLSTSDPTIMALPHPLLFQIHAIISRIMAMKAAAGFPVLPDNDIDINSQDGLPADYEYGSDDSDWCTDRDYSGPPDTHQHKRIDGEVEDRNSPRILNYPGYLPKFNDNSSPPSIAQEPPYHTHKCGHVQENGDGCYGCEKSRMINAINAEYPLRMAERYTKMTEKLGRKLDGTKWWGDTDLI